MIPETVHDPAKRDDPATEPGVWITWWSDYGVNVQAVHADELSALRVSNKSDLVQASFVRFNQSLDEQL